MWCGSEMVVVVAVGCAGGVEKRRGEELKNKEIRSFVVSVCLLGKGCCSFLFGELLVVVVVVFDRVGIEINNNTDIGSLLSPRLVNRR
jgi:hypothetical protein